MYTGECYLKNKNEAEKRVTKSKTNNKLTTQEYKNLMQTKMSGAEALLSLTITRNASSNLMKAKVLSRTNKSL
jgi:predicted XRE-type DNA-binding protein